MEEGEIRLEPDSCYFVKFKGSDEWEIAKYTGSWDAWYVIGSEVYENMENIEQIGEKIIFPK